MLRPIARELGERRLTVARTPVLARAAARLERLLGDLAVGDPYVPEAKALLSRDGGVCPRDGARLAFDPDAPLAHRCPRCHETFEGERHHRAWVTRYHLWLSERAVHLALLGALSERRDLTARAGRILTAYAARYHQYRNADNVLGPTRLFFSTYLESIWLVQVVVASAMLEAADRDAVTTAEWAVVRRMVGDSAALIAEFEEGWSNRQVWNATALVAAGGWLDDARLRDRGWRGPWGLASLARAVDDDGLWHEGENYHLFATRGFLLAAELIRWQGGNLYEATRLDRTFGAPLVTLLPDLTLPARGDAPYGVSVRQPRFCELWELGRARARDPRLEGILARLYASDGPELDDAGRRELAEQEINRPAHRQHRDRAGWKALLWMRPDDPTPGDDGSAASRLLETQGLAVLRPAPRRTAMLECGRRAGGHAHPDRLHVSLAWETPVLADFGTGSYVRPSLHWYRSALAHNAPIPTGGGQAPVPAVCDGFGSVQEWSWCRARADGLCGPDTEAVRTVVAGRDLVLDVVDLRALPGVMIDLPIHPLIPLVGPAGMPVLAPDAVPVGHETGYDRVTGWREREAADGRSPVAADAQVVVLLAPRRGERILGAVAPGPPDADLADGAPRTFLVRRAAGSGRWVQLVAAAARQPEVRLDGDAIHVTEGGVTTEVRLTASGAEVRCADGRRVALPARQPLPTPPQRARTEPTVVRVPLVAGRPTLDAWPDGAAWFALDAPDYRRSETAHGAHGPFRAEVAVVAHEDALVFRVAVVKRPVVVRAADADDPRLDNEAADIHSDGVQCYVGGADWAGWVVLPDLEGGSVRARGVAGTAGPGRPVAGTSRRTAEGYEVLVRCPTGRPVARGDLVQFTVTVNEMHVGRERRAGQLALAGGGWVYLRGDRESPEAALVAELA